jgi:hypothetical protein
LLFGIEATWGRNAANWFCFGILFATAVTIIDDYRRVRKAAP